jgi:cobalt-zinc-cadmium efflux system outer membrane protein
MALFPRAGFRARFALVLLLAAAGCSSAKPQVRQPAIVESPRETAGADSVLHTQQRAQPRRTGVELAHQRLPAVKTTAAVEKVAFLGEAELSLPELVREVESRNPSVQAMMYAWQAMAQRYPQAVSLDDPMFMAMVAPASFGSNQVESAYVLQGTQKLPWFGKRPTRGQAAQAEASAAFQDMNDTRLQINQVTRVAFYDYYLVQRQLELIDENSTVMHEFRDTAQVKYENNQVTQQDVLQADVELADTERRRIEIERMRRVAIARINTLLRRAPMNALPPPPSSLVLETDLPEIAHLQQTASVQRPDLGALAARVRAEEAAVTLALKQYYPDAEFFGRYDSFWQPAATQSDLRGQVGMNMNVPLYRGKLQAAVCEAQFRLSQRRAEYQQRQLDIQYEVQAAYEAVQESWQAAELYSKKFLPFAEQNLEVARSNYDVGKTTFLSLAQAQRQLIEVRAKYQQTLADYYRRRAELDRAVGGGLPSIATVEEIPGTDRGRGARIEERLNLSS